MNVLRFFIYSNLLVSCSAGFLAGSIAYELGNPHKIGVGLVVFCATLFIYNIQRLIRMDEVKTKDSIRHNWIVDNDLLLMILAGVGLFGSIAIYLLLLGIEIDILFLGGSAILGLLYALNIHPKASALRDIPFLKIYLIAVQWTLVVVFWPYMRIAEEVDYPFGLGLSVFFFILAQTVPFDIRDLIYDNKNKRTIPQIFGVKGAKWIAFLFLIASGLFLWLFSPEVIVMPLFYVVYLVSLLLIGKSSIKSAEMYFSGGIDAWIMAYAFLLLLL